MGRWTRRARTLKGLSRLQWGALVHALLWIPATRAALAFLPWRWVSAAFDRPVVRPGPPDWDRARASVWAIDAVARRFLPRRPCLTQALVGQRALGRLGVETDLRIGAVRDDRGVFVAHAWIEHNGKVVLGGTDSTRRYSPFRAINSPSGGGGFPVSA